MVPLRLWKSHVREMCIAHVRELHAASVSENVLKLSVIGTFDDDDSTQVY